jgi:small subunit ribosomal protein S17
MSEVPTTPDETNATDDAIVTEQTEAVTASAPDRSTDEVTAGVASASEQPDASESSSESEMQPDASESSSEREKSSRSVRKTREGFVVSQKMEKTVVVAVIERVRHPKYNKFVLQTKRLYAHDETNDVNVGDKVRVMETRPLSKTKRWRVAEILERAK